MIIEDKNYLEKWYENEDPWGYKDNPDDNKRLDIILRAIGFINPCQLFKKALDVGCGEGFITQHLPAKKLYAYDISDKAMARLPKNIIPLKLEDIKGKYDLVIATGVIYKHSNAQQVIELIKKTASNIVLTCHLKDIEYFGVIEIGKQIFSCEFPYRGAIEKLRIFQV